MVTTTRTQVELDQLLAQACPTQEDTPFFNHCMALAKDRGLTWEEALEYTVEMRNGR
ncbi:MAG: hypothetical protein KGK08_02045 [Acidobacteriota bacterium]|nr:hypothetical protein [Acidobacteriota bacterium]